MHGAGPFFKAGLTEFFFNKLFFLGTLSGQMTSEGKSSHVLVKGDDTDTELEILHEKFKMSRYLYTSLDGDKTKQPRFHCRASLLSLASHGQSFSSKLLIHVRATAAIVTCRSSGNALRLSGDPSLVLLAALVLGDFLTGKMTCQLSLQNPFTIQRL